VQVLVAEADPQSRNVLRAVLTLAGANCRIVCSGDEALREFARQQPDILISDVSMLGGDGFDLIGRIRAMPSEHGGLVPAIAVSGHASADQAKMLGYQAFVPKPIALDSLVRLLAEFVAAGSGSPAPGKVVDG
jgi:CheY-like chemotaxis protein